MSDKPTPPDRLAAHWYRYRAEWMPREVAVNQVLETRRGFYSGAAVAFSLVLATGNLGPVRSADVEDHWPSYRALCIQPDACPTQVLETRRAFFAGAVAVSKILVLGLDPRDGLALLSGLQEEFLRFHQRIGVDR